MGVLSSLFSNPRFFCVVAEQGNQILGSNCMDERSAIAGVGPITVDPTGQNSGVGRLLMKAAMDAVREWRYQPTLLNGEPVEVETTVSVIFTLGG